MARIENGSIYWCPIDEAFVDGIITRQVMEKLRTNHTVDDCLNGTCDDTISIHYQIYSTNKQIEKHQTQTYHQQRQSRAH